MVTESRIAPLRFKSLPEIPMDMGDSPKSFWCKLVESYMAADMERNDAEIKAWEILNELKPKIKAFCEDKMMEINRNANSGK